MPRLIQDGPDIPKELIQKQEAGEVVFFCGAGISVPTGLPSFRELALGLYQALNITPKASEEKAIEQEKFPEALDLLERRVTGDSMRSEVVPLLSAHPKRGSLRLHRALIEVSRNPSDLHLVTTNYDDNFARVDGAKDLRFDEYPTLPDLDNWNSIVHLHGRIRGSTADSGTSRLVLTDTDFGEAYLNDGSAARFLSGLLNRYIVVFVGYSMADVIVRYLTKAVTSSRSANPTYSLVGFTDANQREQLESEWSTTGIQPILYYSGDKHELLVRTVEEWAKLAADPHQYRVNVALPGLQRSPNRAEHEADPDRVVWALSHPAAAWPAFNRIRRTPTTGACAARWLDEFADRGLLGGTVMPGLHERGLAGPVVTHRSEQQMLQSDSVANAVTFWIEIHAHSPEVFHWVINHGRNINFELSRRIWDRLVSTESDLPKIPSRLARLWTLLLAEPPEDAEFLLRLDRILSSLSRDHPEATDDILLRLLRPRLVVFPGPAPFRILSSDESTPEELALLSCGHTDIILGCRDHRRPGVNVLTRIEPRRFGHFLRRHASTLTDYLATAFVLLDQSDRVDARSVRFELSNSLTSEDSGRVSMASSTTGKIPTSEERRRDLHDFVGTWTVLLDWVRESYRALPPDSKERDGLIRCWASSNEKMLRCLALEAIVQDNTADFDLVGPVLVGNTKEILWDPDCVPQVLPVLRQVGIRASSELQGELLDAVQGGIGSDEPGPVSDGAILAKVGFRLAALHMGGVTLSSVAAEILATFKRRQGAERQLASQATTVALGGRIREVAAALRNGSVDSTIFREFAHKRPVAAVLALQELGRGGNWPTTMWGMALDVIQAQAKETKPRHERSAKLVEILLEIPEQLFQDLQMEIARIVEVLAEQWLGTDDSRFWHLWMRGWTQRSQESGYRGPIDALNHSMNTTAGTYASAAIKRIQEVKSKSSDPIPDGQISILSQIAEDESGSAGIVILVFWLEWLYSNAEEWTNRHLLPRMRWGDASPSDELNQEVRTLWGVVAFRGWIYSRPVRRALGSDLWMAVQCHKLLDHGKKLARFFVYASLAPLDDLIDDSTCRETARVVIRDNPWQVAVALGNLLDEEDKPREEVWRNLVRPWLHRYWPREKALNTGQSSSALVEVIMAAGDAFPEAVNWANDYLMPLNDHQVSAVWYHKSTWKSHPRATVALLYRIVPQAGIDPAARMCLGEMLKTLREVDETIPQDSRFVELEERAAK